MRRIRDYAHVRAQFGDHRLRGRTIYARNRREPLDQIGLFAHLLVQLGVDLGQFHVQRLKLAQ